MILYSIKFVFMSMKKTWFSGWTNLSCSTLLCSLDWTVGGNCQFSIVVHPDEGGGLKMELAEEKAQYHLWAACITPVSVITRRSAGQRWVLEATEKYNTICLIVDLFRWDPVLELHMLPPGFPQRFILQDIFLLFFLWASGTILQCAWSEKDKGYYTLLQRRQHLSLPALPVQQ